MFEMGRQSALLEKVEAWLFSQGCSELWLTTDLDKRLRAYSFYKKHGWSDWYPPRKTIHGRFSTVCRFFAAKLPNRAELFQKSLAEHDRSLCVRQRNIVH